MKYTEQQLVEQFERSIGAVFLTIDAFEREPNVVERYGVDVADGLLDEQMYNVAGWTGELLYKYPTSGLNAYADFGDVILLVSERLGGVHPIFERMAEKYLHAHYSFGRLPVKVYKDNDVEIVEQQGIKELCLV